MTKKVAVLAACIAVSAGTAAHAQSANPAASLGATSAASPQAVALQSHILTSDRSAADLQAVYAQRGYEPIWTGRSTEVARAFVQAMQTTYDHGLPAQTD
ncbi:MAG: hypothetical protein AAFQ51_16860, partial [Pseudomonadota bacterium]